MLRQSGGMADYTALSQECDLSRPTVKAHLEAMRVACALPPVPPFHGGSRREIVKRPRVYAFDTGFVCFVRGWERLRDEDRGGLWEHLVLDALRTAMEPARTVWTGVTSRHSATRTPAAGTSSCRRSSTRLTTSGSEHTRCAPSAPPT